MYGFPFLPMFDPMYTKVIAELIFVYIKNMLGTF